MNLGDPNSCKGKIRCIIQTENGKMHEKFFRMHEFQADSNRIKTCQKGDF